MSRMFAYSFTREDFTGRFDSEQAALAAAMEKAAGEAEPPTTIYVGQVVESEHQANDHAERILEAMNRRAHVDLGEQGARYLRRVPVEWVRELDQAVEQVILQWLWKHDLTPNWVRVQSIREFAVPNPRWKADSSPGLEVSDIGQAPLPTDVIRREE
jgi:hypothetical protein